MAAPMRLEMEKRRPKIGIRSASAAAKPNAASKVRFSGPPRRDGTQLTSVVPLALFDEGGYLLRSHMLRLVVLEVEEACQLMQYNGKTEKYDLQARASTAPCQVP